MLLQLACLAARVNRNTNEKRLTSTVSWIQLKPLTPYGYYKLISINFLYLVKLVSSVLNIPNVLPVSHIDIL
jgi:hypothetical protein